MNLHLNKQLFAETIRATSQTFKINSVFIEKDYWITLVLSQLSQSSFCNRVVFKGGTSLSKAYNIINRFSEDVDIALIDESLASGNEIKNIIRSVEKEMTRNLQETIIEGVTSKGSRFRKSVFEYQSIDARNASNKLIVEVNSFANPFPFETRTIKSFVHDFLLQTGNNAFITEYNLQPFDLQILHIQQTLLEKLISLIRFSFDANPIQSVASKIRHFYDIYFILMNPECLQFIKSNEFIVRCNEIFEHDKQVFDVPKDWNSKEIQDSPLCSNFEMMWNQLKDTYSRELSALAYNQIPNERDVAAKFEILLAAIKK